MLNSELNQIIKKIELDQQIQPHNCLEQSLLTIARAALVEYSALLNNEAVRTLPFNLEGQLTLSGTHER